MSWVDESNVTIQESSDGLSWNNVSTYIIPKKSLTYIDYIRTLSTTDLEVSMMLKG